MDDKAIQDIAASLRKAHESHTPIAPIRETLASGGVEAAYAVQQANTDHYLKHGRRLVGRKIGLTSKSVQKQLGVDSPDFGMLYADMALYDGEEIDMKRVLQPKVEAEIAFVLEGDLTMSRLHLLIERDPGGAFWVTAKGQNPVLVNGRPIPRERSIGVDTGQVIQICSYSVTIR